MTRGNQRENDQAKARAKNDKLNPKKGKETQGAKQTLALNTADIMREKQRKAELKKQGIVEEEVKPDKVIDESYLKQFEYLEVNDDEEEKKTSEEEEKKEEEVIQPKGKKGKKNKM